MAHYFIVEGPDGSGKTTLVNQLMAAFPGAKKLHFGKPETDEEAFNYWKRYMQAIKDNADESVVIFDRCWYSDLVYGPVLRGREEMLQENVENLELAIKGCGGGVILYCTGKKETLWKRCQLRGEDYVKKCKQHADLHAKYEEVMKTPKYLPVIRYDTTVRW